MTALSSDNFLVGLSTEIDKLTQHYVMDGYGALADFLKAPLGSLMVLYIVLMGFAISRGLVDKLGQELFKFAIKAGLIYTFAMNWDFFASYARDLLVDGSESIASTLMHALSKKSTSSINQGLQEALNDIMRLSLDLLNAGSYRKLAPFLAGLIVMAVGFLTVGLAFIEIVIAKLMLAIMLCTAPLFIIFTLFHETKSFFERWLGTAVGFGFVLIFVSAVVGLCLHLLHWVMTFVASGQELNATIWVPLGLVSILCVMAIKEATCIGKSIGGHICTSHGTAMLGSFIGGSMGAWASSTTGFSKSTQLGRQGLQGISRMASKGHGLMQQMQKNLRRGA
jgi:type IV secretion system protein VirB6